jgi:hypothetical protein
MFADAKICRDLAEQNNGTTTMQNQTWNISNNTNRLAPQRLESLKNSYSELNLLSKTDSSDFIFDFDKAVTGISTGTGGRTVAATVSLPKISFSIH